MLADGERLVFDRLVVFAGGFDSAAARAVVTGEGIEAWDVVDVLASVVAKSMLVAEDTRDSTTRYQMLETLRQYARERLDETKGAGAGGPDEIPATARIVARRSRKRTTDSHW